MTDTARTVRLPGPLYAEYDRWSQEVMRSTPDLIRVTLTRALQARRMKQREQGAGIVHRAISNGGANAGQ
jgi:hypothetical protein